MLLTCRWLPESFAESHSEKLHVTVNVFPMKLAKLGRRHVTGPACILHMTHVSTAWLAKILISVTGSSDYGVIRSTEIVI